MVNANPSFYFLIISLICAIQILQGDKVELLFKVLVVGDVGTGKTSDFLMFFIVTICNFVKI